MSTILYSRTGIASVQSGDNAYEPNDEGAFELPDDLASNLAETWVGGEKVWETHPERVARLEAERMQKRRDPSTLLDQVESLTQLLTPSDPASERASAADLRAKGEALIARADELDAQAAEAEKAAADAKAEAEKQAAEDEKKAAAKKAADEKKAAAAAAKK